MSNARSFEAICLSGGGTKAIGHLGVLHYYYEKGELNLDPNGVTDFAGTSAGSIINLLLIAGYIPIEILSEVYGINNFFAGDGTININIWELLSEYGILSIDVPIKLVEKLVIKKLGKIPTLWELYKITGKRLMAPSVNISKKPSPDLVYITPETHPHMKCTDVVKLSSKLPLIFRRIQYNGEYYEDGGLGDNFPIKTISPDKKTLGVIVTGSDIGTSTLPFINYLYRTIMFPINTNTHLRSKNLGGNVKIISMNFDDVPVIELSMENSRKMGMFMKGYKEAEREEKKIKLYLKNWSWKEPIQVTSPLPIIPDGWDVEW